MHRPSIRVRSAGSPARPLVGLLVGLLAAAALLVTADVASAHGDTGAVTVTRAEQSGPDRIAIEVGIVHDDDGHLATDATVTATLSGPAGDSVGPVPLEQVDPESSLYGAEVQVSGPGSWSVEVTSTGPDATAQAEVDVVQSEDTTTTEDSTTTEAPATTEVPVDGTGSAADVPLDAVADDSSSGGDNRWLLVGAAAVAVALVVVVTLALRRNGGGDPDGDAHA